MPGILPSFSAANRLLSEVGAVEQGRIQQGIDEARGRFEFAQQEPAQRLGRYSGLIQSNILPGTTTQTAGGPSDAQKLAGGAMSGLGAYALGTQSGLIGTGSAALLTPGVGQAVAAGLALLSILD